MLHSESRKTFLLHITQKLVPVQRKHPVPKEREGEREREEINGEWLTSNSKKKDRLLNGREGESGAGHRILMCLLPSQIRPLSPGQEGIRSLPVLCHAAPFSFVPKDSKMNLAPRRRQRRRRARALLHSARKISMHLKYCGNSAS